MKGKEKEIWIKADDSVGTWDEKKARITASLESGIDGVLVEETDIAKIKELGRIKIAAFVTTESPAKTKKEADITGTKIYEHRTAAFSTQKGPIFSNFILADEINRAPPKVQSALLEAMQERQVTIQGETFKLDTPFMVMATQNPIETEGTYKLPEAQVDRFTFKLLIEYPNREEEKTIIQRNTQGIEITPAEVLTGDEVIEIQRFNQRIYADEKIEDYVTELVDATRYPANYELGGDLEGLIEYGASPRASIWLILTGKAHALLNERGYVIPEDIKAVAHEVLRHRLILTYEAEAEGITSDNIIDKILATVKAP